MSAIELTPAGKPLHATLTLPGSKGLTECALLIAALADGTSILDNVLLTDDTQRMIDALRALGIRIEIIPDDERAIVTGCRGLIPESEADIFCGNAHTLVEFIAALAALGGGNYRLDASPALRQRSIIQLVDALRSLGGLVEHTHEEPFLPIVVHARGLRGGTVAFDAVPSSQLLSAVLLIAPYARSDVFVEVRGHVANPCFLRMAQQIMADFGVTVIERDTRKFIVAATQRYRATDYTIEPDAANALYFLAAPVVAGGHVTVENLPASSAQPDLAFLDLLEQMGCSVDRNGDGLTVHAPPPNRPLRGIDADLSRMPDVVYTLAVLALFARSPTSIRNVAAPRTDRTDRLAALAAELTKLGAEVETPVNGLVIHPPDRITPRTINTYDDPRMAMAFALAALAVEGVIINDPQCAEKNFPDFFSRFQNLTDPR